MINTMFENYRMTPSNYIPTNTKSAVLENPPKFPLVLYNKFDEPIGFTWNYGDTVVLKFITEGNVVYDELGFTEDAQTYLSDKMFNLTVYNDRYEAVAQCKCDAGISVEILSDGFYPKTLVKGVYHLKLELLDEEENILTTLIGWDDLIIYIR